MPNWILTGIAAGLAAAAMQGAALSLSLFSIIIFYLSPLPLFLTGFSRGWASALLGAGVMAIALAFLTGNMAFALMALVSAGLAPVVASMLSMISRTASQTSAGGKSTAEGETSVEGEARSDDREWYPEGRLVLWLAAIAAGVTGISILAMGSDFETFKAFLTTQVTPVLDAFEKQLPPDQPAFPRESFITMMVTALPIVASSVWLLSTVTSMRIAIVVLSRSKKALRPWALFDKLAFPANSVIVILAALAAAYFLSGVPKLLALGAVGAFVTAFTLLGLAVVHHLLANNSARPLLLGLLYSSLLLFSWLLAVPLTVLGLADLNFKFRKSKPNQT